MKNAVVVAALTVGTLLGSSVVAAREPVLRRWVRTMADNQPWHGQYYYLPYGQPTALVVPPNSSMEQQYSWGVSQNKTYPIYHQYALPAMPSPGGVFYATPPWPSHTTQFGVYPVRAPW